MRHRTKESITQAFSAMKPITRTSLSDEIVDQIVVLISEGVLKPGERLPSEKGLANQFGVGRTTIREALRALAVMGIVDGRVGEGTFVSSLERRPLEKALKWGLLIDRKDVQDLIETRLLLESHTAFWAAHRASQANLQEIEQAILGMEESVHDPERYLKSDLQFHLSVARSSQNTILFQLVSMTRSYLQVWIQRSLSLPASNKSHQRAKTSIREHKMILEAIRSGNAEKARQSMSAHILSSSKDLQSQLAVNKTPKGGRVL